MLLAAVFTRANNPPCAASSPEKYTLQGLSSVGHTINRRQSGSVFCDELSEMRRCDDTANRASPCWTPGPQSVPHWHGQDHRQRFHFDFQGDKALDHLILCCQMSSLTSILASPLRLISMKTFEVSCYFLLWVLQLRIQFQATKYTAAARTSALA